MKDRALSRNQLADIKSTLPYGTSRRLDSQHDCFTFQAHSERPRGRSQIHEHVGPSHQDSHPQKAMLQLSSMLTVDACSAALISYNFSQREWDASHTTSQSSSQSGELKMENGVFTRPTQQQHSASAKRKAIVLHNQEPIKLVIRNMGGKVVREELYYVDVPPRATRRPAKPRDARRICVG